MQRGTFTYNLWTRSRDAVIIALARRHPAGRGRKSLLRPGEQDRYAAISSQAGKARNEATVGE